MKRIVFIICCWTFALTFVNAQSLEQKKICALKWTLQQTFYNKPEGQQIARLNVCDFKSLSDFQKNKLISDAIKKISNPADQGRVKNILSATDASNLQSYVPAGAHKEFKADLDKVKSTAPVTNESEEEEATEEEEDVVEEPTEAPAPDIQPVEEQNEEATPEDVAADGTQPEEPATATEGVSFLEAVLIALGLYVILTGCIFLFIRSKKNTQKNEEMVTMEQYRAERVRLMERIKAVEIEMENIKSQKRDKQQDEKPVAAVAQPIEPAAPQHVAEKAEAPAEPQSPSLFSETIEPAPAVEEPVVAPRPKFSAVMFYPVPVDGVFLNGTSDIEVGKSLYMLKTSDDQNATFQILNTPEAIATALISMNEMVKPACKILNTVAAPVEILAEKLGTAEREGDGWRITNKAVVRLI